MGYRNPAYLAKVAATIDMISGGRVEMGIGAGWYEHEWRPTATASRRAGERWPARRGRADHAAALDHRPATLNGKHYQVDGAICRPLPLQEGGIPLWIAGGGEQKTLRIAAKYASYTNFDGDARESSGASRRSWPSTAARSAPTSTRSCARPTTT